MEKYEKFELKLKWFNGYISEPNIQYFESGTCKTTFSIPLKQQKDDEPRWIYCSVWNKSAEEISEKYKKGDFITIGGIFKEREYKGKKYIDFEVLIYK